MDIKIKFLNRCVFFKFGMEEDKYLPLIYGHRGASGYKVDNTMSAFDLAIEQGVDGIESDVQLTSDGVPFLYHDSRIRVKREDGVLEVKPSEIHSKELDDVILPENERVPTVEQFFAKYGDLCANSGEKLLFSFDYHLNDGEITCNLAKKYNCEDQLFMCANFGPLFKKVRNVSKKVHLVASNSIRFLTFLTFKKNWSKYCKYDVEVFNVKAADFQEEYKEKLLEAGFQFYIWDLHDEERLRKNLPYRPHGIYSNYPDLALKIRKELFGA